MSSATDWEDLFGAQAPAPQAADTVFTASALARLRARDVLADLRSAGVEVGDEFATAVAEDAWTVSYEPSLECAGELSQAAAARADWWRALAASEDTARMRAASVLRGAVAEVGAAALLRSWVEYQEQEQEREQAAGGGGDAEGEGDGAGGGAGDPAAEGERIARASAAARRAAAAAAEAAEQAAAVADAAGIGAGETVRLPDEQIAEAIRAGLRSPFVVQIARAAGRLQRALRSARAAVVRRAEGRGGLECVGAEGLARLVPGEAAALVGAAGDAQRLLALARVADRRSLAYAPDRRRARAERGPIVVAVDESGSMAGDRIVAAKGLALALAALAVRDRRVALLVGWGTRGQCRVHWIRPGKPEPAGLVAWASEQFGGGTECHVPLVEVPRMIDEAPELRGRSDVIILTDGQVDVPADVRARWDDWRARTGARALLIGVGVEHAGAIARACDRAVYVPRPDDPAAIEAAAGAL